MIFKRATLVFASLIASMLFSFVANASEFMKCDAVEQLPTIKADVSFLADVSDINDSDTANYFTSKEKAAYDTMFYSYRPDDHVHFSLNEIDMVTVEFELDLDSAVSFNKVIEVVPYNQLE